LSLTVAHGLGDDLRQLRVRLARAWQGMIRGAPWARFRRLHGIHGTVRAVELTHGKHGWHPHLHVLLLLDAPIDPREIITAERPDGSTVDTWAPKFGGLAWLIDRWHANVVRALGAEHAPSEYYGLTLQPCSAVDYICKLGLELSDPGHKGGRSGGRTPWQIAADWMEHKHPGDAALWTSYVSNMHGAKQLTWSVGLRHELGIRDEDDDDLTLAEEASAGVTLGVLEGAAWLGLRDQWRDGVPLAWALLDAARDGALSLARACRALGLAEIGGIWCAAPARDPVRRTDPPRARLTERARDGPEVSVTWLDGFTSWDHDRPTREAARAEHRIARLLGESGISRNAESLHARLLAEAEAELDHW
jgi:hypothetical protein